MWPQAFLLLMVVGSAGAATVLALVAAAQRRARVFRRAAVLAGVITTGYVLLVAGAATTASKRTLALGEEKYICELDCHLAYSVMGVQRRGDSLFVHLKVRSDRTTGGRSGSDLPIYPGPRAVELLDRRGRKLPPVSLGDLGRTLLPGESYQTELVFDVDRSAAGLILYISDADPAKMVLLGSDNAPLRRPVGFRL